MPLEGKKVGCLGAGAMGGALLEGLVRSGLVPPAHLAASDVREDRLRFLSTKLGIRTYPENGSLLAESDVVILAVKPPQVPAVLEEVAPHVRVDRHLLVSIAAGVTTATVERRISGPVRVVRVMPNTPCLVGSGASAYCLGRHATPADGEIVAAIFGAVGRVVAVEETLMDAVTGLSGSGPAYMFLLLDAFIEAGVRVGLPREAARVLAAQTMLGAARMLLETGEHPAVLRDMVTTPGGTTAAGLFALEHGRLRAVIMEAVAAATRRAGELFSDREFCQPAGTHNRVAFRGQNSRSNDGEFCQRADTDDTVAFRGQNSRSKEQ